MHTAWLIRQKQDKLLISMGSNSSSSPPLDGRALFYMVLLAIQFGIQPILTRNYTAPGINKSTVILMQEAVKFVRCSQRSFEYGNVRRMPTFLYLFFLFSSWPSSC